MSIQKLNQNKRRMCERCNKQHRDNAQRKKCYNIFAKMKKQEQLQSQQNYSKISTFSKLSILSATTYDQQYQLEGFQELQTSTKTDDLSTILKITLKIMIALSQFQASFQLDNIYENLTKLERQYHYQLSHQWKNAAIITKKYKTQKEIMQNNFHYYRNQIDEKLQKIKLVIKKFTVRCQIVLKKLEETNVLKLIDQFQQQVTNNTASQQNCLQFTTATSNLILAYQQINTKQKMAISNLIFKIQVFIKNMAGVDHFFINNKLKDGVKELDCFNICVNKMLSISKILRQKSGRIIKNIIQNRKTKYQLLTKKTFKNVLSKSNYIQKVEQPISDRKNKSIVVPSWLQISATLKKLIAMIYDKKNLHIHFLEPIALQINMKSKQIKMKYAYMQDLVVNKRKISKIKQAVNEFCQYLLSDQQTLSPIDMDFFYQSLNELLKTFFQQQFQSLIVGAVILQLRTVKKLLKQFCVSAQVENCFDEFNDTINKQKQINVIAVKFIDQILLETDRRVGINSLQKLKKFVSDIMIKKESVEIQQDQQVKYQLKSDRKKQQQQQQQTLQFYPHSKVCKFLRFGLRHHWYIWAMLPQQKRQQVFIGTYMSTKLPQIKKRLTDVQLIQNINTKVQRKRAIKSVSGIKNKVVYFQDLCGEQKRYWINVDKTNIKIAKQYGLQNLYNQTRMYGLGNVKFSTFLIQLYKRMDLQDLVFPQQIQIGSFDTQRTQSKFLSSFLQQLRQKNKQFFKQNPTIIKYRKPTIDEQRKLKKRQIIIQSINGIKALIDKGVIRSRKQFLVHNLNKLNQQLAEISQLQLRLKSPENQLSLSQLNKQVCTKRNIAQYRNKLMLLIKDKDVSVKYFYWRLKKENQQYYKKDKPMMRALSDFQQKTGFLKNRAAYLIQSFSIQNQFVSHGLVNLPQQIFKQPLQQAKQIWQSQINKLGQLLRRNKPIQLPKLNLNLHDIIEEEFRFDRNQWVFGDLPYEMQKQALRYLKLYNFADYKEFINFIDQRDSFYHMMPVQPFQLLKNDFFTRQRLYRFENIMFLYSNQVSDQQQTKQILHQIQVACELKFLKMIGQPFKKRRHQYYITALLQSQFMLINKHYFCHLKAQIKAQIKAEQQRKKFNVKHFSGNYQIKHIDFDKQQSNQSQNNDFHMYNKAQDFRVKGYGPGIQFFINYQKFEELKKVQYQMALRQFCGVNNQKIQAQIINQQADFGQIDNSNKLQNQAAPHKQQMHEKALQKELKNDQIIEFQQLPNLQAQIINQQADFGQIDNLDRLQNQAASRKQQMHEEAFQRELKNDQIIEFQQLPNLYVCRLERKQLNKHPLKSKLSLFVDPGPSCKHTSQSFHRQVKMFFYNKCIEDYRFQIRRNIADGKKIQFVNCHNKKGIKRLLQSQVQLLQKYETGQRIFPLNYVFINKKIGGGFDASRDIKKNEVVSFFNGKIMTVQQGQKANNNHNMMDYIKMKVNGHIKQLVITTCDNVWGLGPMFNHSDQQSANIEIMGYLTKYGMQYIMTAIRDINKGQHLTWNYSSGESKTYKMQDMMGKPTAIINLQSLLIKNRLNQQKQKDRDLLNYFYKRAEHYPFQMLGQIQLRQFVRLHDQMLGNMQINAIIKKMQNKQFRLFLVGQKIHQIYCGQTLIMPVFVSGNHWLFLKVSVGEQSQIEIFDSIKRNRQVYDEILNDTILQIKKCLPNETKLQLKINQQFHQQTDGVNCGIFMLAGIRQIVNNMKFDPTKIAKIRNQLATMLLK